MVPGLGLGPADLQRRNANLVEGDVGGGTYRLRQVILRPMPKLSPYTTPVRGLYLGMDKPKIDRVLDQHCATGEPVEGWALDYD